MMPGVRVDRLGIVLVLAASAAFGANAIFAKLVFERGGTVGEFLSIRFCIAAIAFWIVLRPRIARRELAPGLLLGLAYCGQAGFYFTAVSLQDASVTSVFQSVTPAIVAVAAVLAGRERPRLRIFGAIAVAAVGTAMVGLGGGEGVGHVVPLGVALSIASSVWYAGYLLAGERIVAGIDPLVLGCLIATGGGIGFAVGSAALGELHFDFAPSAWIFLIASALASTVFAVTAIMAGMKRVGPSLAGLLQSFETVATITYAYLIFGERLTPLQLAGAAAVLLAVVAVQLPGRRRATVSA
jgi:drug/metabolite transporter (DMT)-like permease